MDAYSYIMRDRVFANAQTGNMLLLGVSISERNWPEVVRYLFPVLAFAAGIMLADLVRFGWMKKKASLAADFCIVRGDCPCRRVLYSGFS